MWDPQDQPGNLAVPQSSSHTSSQTSPDPGLLGSL